MVVDAVVEAVVELLGDLVARIADRGEDTRSGDDEDTVTIEDARRE